MVGVRVGREGSRGEMTQRERGWGLLSREQTETKEGPGAFETKQTLQQFAGEASECSP